MASKPQQAQRLRTLRLHPQVAAEAEGTGSAVDERATASEELAEADVVRAMQLADAAAETAAGQDVVEELQEAGSGRALWMHRHTRMERVEEEQAGVADATTGEAPLMQRCV